MSPEHPQRPRPRVTLVVARARDGAIGRGNALPWRLPEDLEHFKATTLGRAVVMGRLTHESIGRPLPGRRNLVLSRTRGYAPAGVEVLGSLPEALAACAGDDEVFVIGGARLYEAALPLADRAVVTEVDTEVDAADAFFPALDPAQWAAGARRDAVSRTGLRYSIVDYARRRADARDAADA